MAEFASIFWESVRRTAFGSDETRRCEADFLFDADTELAFLRAAGEWEFPIHFRLAKTGMRVGELIHLLIEDVDLRGGWVRVRNKAALGWRIKTGLERSIPLLPEVVDVLRRVIGDRPAGVIFRRKRFMPDPVFAASGNRGEHELICKARARRAIRCRAQRKYESPAPFGRTPAR